MRIDIEKRKPILSNVMGGLSGPAVFPVAVRMVYQVRKAVSVPILGMGGIRTGRDIVEMMLAGAGQCIPPVSWSVQRAADHAGI